MRYHLFAGIMILLSFVFFSCERESDSLLNMDSQEPDIQAVSKAKESSANIGINIVLNTSITDDILADLASYGHVMDVFDQIDGVRVKAKADKLSLIQSLPYVEAAGPDAERNAPPVDTVPVEDFTAGLSTWNLDAVNVTDPGFDNRQVTQDGTGVYVGVLDTGLLDSWRQYFPQERIAAEYAKCFGGGGASGINVSEQPNKWEHDQDSHGTHVTSIILGYSLDGTPINGVAPNATFIPVKVLNQTGSGWSSVIAEGILYMAGLKEGPLANSPVVVNMSLGGGALDPLEKAAIDYAIEAGVIIVASAGNNGVHGMGYPGAYEPVISVAASGFVGEWQPFYNPYWWYNLDVPEPTNPANFYITDFSSRELPG
ncbi:MAG: S8 family serine peptidase, partial [Calditrichaceae bacterium]